MRLLGFPIFLLFLACVGVFGALMLTPKDILRQPVVSEFARPAPVHRVREAPAVLELASATLEVSATPVEPVATPRPAPVAAPAADIRWTTASALNMRAEPNKFADLVTSLPQGSRVSVSDTSGSWARVTTDSGATGWMSANFLTTEPAN